MTQRGKIVSTSNQPCEHCDLSLDTSWTWPRLGEKIKWPLEAGGKATVIPCHRHSSGSEPAPSPLPLDAPGPPCPWFVTLSFWSLNLSKSAQWLRPPGIPTGAFSNLSVIARDPQFSDRKPICCGCYNWFCSPRHLTLLLERTVTHTKSSWKTPWRDMFIF